jgi:prepilin-type N-terminal cleavage/methylation domain-containing protein
MKKQGFTLVELLAVIAILAILVIIALPNVLKMFNDAKKNSFLTEAKTVYGEAGKKYISDSITSPSNNEHIYCKSKTDSLNPLSLSGRGINYYIKTDSNGNVNTIVVWDDTRYIALKSSEISATSLNDAKDITDDIKNATCDNILEKIGYAIVIKPEYKVTSSVLYRDATHLSVKMSMEGLSNSDINSVKYVVYRNAKGDTDFVKVHSYIATNKAEGFNYTFLDETNPYSMDTKYQVVAYTDDNRKIDEILVSYVYCFVKGTKVKTENGFKNIEDIKIGDKVYSYNLDNNSLELKKVLNTIKSNTIDTYKATIGGKTVEMSPKHQLYIIDKGWVRAYDLNVNDKLLDVNGKQVSISKIEYIKYDSPIDTYNLTIEGNNNYFVTDIQVLVHNAASPT